jgi:hypothetical protein
MRLKSIFLAMEAIFPSEVAGGSLFILCDNAELCWNRIKNVLQAGMKKSPEFELA